jgi:cis-3-alkyl-4-acyloxetan-2-one decarboxylase
MCQLLRQIVDRISPDKPVTLMLHDWGCIFGYEFAMRHAERVARVVAVDVGDHNSGALLRSWGIKEKLSVMGYQVWLALAWKMGGTLGTRMTRAMARWLRCPTDAERITHKMNYPYAMQWFGTAGGFQACGANPVAHAALVCLWRAQTLHVPFGQMAGKSRRPRPAVRCKACPVAIGS